MRLISCLSALVITSFNYFIARIAAFCEILESDFALTVEEEVSRNAGHVQVVVDFVPLLVCEAVVVAVDIGQTVLPFVFGRGFSGDVNEDCTLLLEFRFDLIDVAHRGAAGRTPSGPKIEESHFAGVILLDRFERLRPAEVGIYLADHGLCTVFTVGSGRCLFCGLGSCLRFCIVGFILAGYDCGEQQRREEKNLLVHNGWIL